MNLNQVTLPALDIEQSTQFYLRMGFTQIVHALQYARFECPEGDSTFSIHLVDGTTKAPGIIVYFECSNLDERVAALQTAGFRFTKGLRDERWLWKEARLEDPAGNVLCLFWGGVNRKHPPWRLAPDSRTRPV